jgi:tetratricopeptide (TPR) repeat protein
MNNLAVAYGSAKQFDRSVPLLEETLKLRQAKLGPDHLNTLLTMANLGINYRNAGRLPEAIAMLEQAQDRARQFLGGLPAQLAWIPPDLAVTYDAAGLFAKAEPFYRSALAQAEKQFGVGDPRTWGFQAQLGLNMLNQKKYADAETLLRDCLRIREQKQPDAWTTFNTRSMLGGSLLGQKKYADAEPFLLSGFDGMKQRAAEIPLMGKVRLVEAAQRLVDLYEAWERPEQAAQWRATLEAERAKLPGKHP